jgi:hypothetical protein
VKRESFLLFFVVFFSSAYFYQAGFSNPNTRYDLSLALAYRGTVRIDDFHGNTIDKVFRDGHYFIEKAPLTSYLAFPAALVTKLLVPFEKLQHSEKIADISLYFATITSVSVISALSAIFFFGILTLVRPESRRSDLLFITFCTYCGTLMFPYSTTLFGHQLAASFLIMGLYFCLRCVRFAQTLDYLLGGLFLGLMVCTEYPTGLIAVAFFGAVTYTNRNRVQTAIGIIAASFPLILVLIHNYVSFGNVLLFGYSQLQGSPFETGMSSGFFGISFPNLTHLRELLFGPYRGLFIYCPILIPALAGYAKWIKLPKAEFGNLPYVFLLCCISILLVNAGYFFWQGGVCFGPRHLTVTIPLLAIGLAFLPREILYSPLILCVAAVSILFNLVGTSTTLFLGEELTNPLFENYLGSFFFGHLAINPVSFATQFDQIGERWMHIEQFRSVSFNLGQVLGLKGLFSLSILFGVWAIYLGHLYLIKQAEP